MAHLVARGRTARKWYSVRYRPRGGKPGEWEEIALHTDDRARALAEKARVERDLEEPVTRAPSLPQGGLLDAFLDSRRVQGCAAGTVRFYEAKVGPLLRHLAAVPMARWNRSHLEGWLALPRTPPWSERQRGAVITAARTMREWMAECGYDVGELVGRLRPPKIRRERRAPLTVEQVRSMLAAARGPYRLAVALAAFAGLRTNDIRTLDRKHVDLVGGWITKTATKNDAALRIPIPAPLRAAIEGAPVVAGPICRIAKESATRRRLAAIYDDAGIPRARGDGLHRLRHFYASMLDEVGASEGERRDLLGHLGHDVSSTYVDRVRDERLRAVVARFEAKIGAA
jgi:integrase